MAGHGLRDDCVLVTFDIDGTLIESEGPDANLIHKDAFAIAFESLGLQGASIEDCKHHGMTDPLIIQLIVEHHRGCAGGRTTPSKCLPSPYRSSAIRTDPTYPPPATTTLCCVFRLTTL